MWIQLLLPVELPTAKKAKTRRTRKAKPSCTPWIQIEIEFQLADLVSHTPSLIKRAWNWIKTKIRSLLK